uniref:Uncharacterized protein n=1 Tax=Aegilops tauschii subsp. strangulata TaxID=200361 RepID=A0A453C5F1_AEGTS
MILILARKIFRYCSTTVCGVLSFSLISLFWFKLHNVF